ncbi:alpha-amylase family glycosyl hydrolase [Methylobacterium sp. WL103]|uniref:alpha-amylase family glycosyl hydrolase n=1 Tax=Methylobacterium sp. WL103 TaxID=2603891 RepID=UPI001FEE9DF8|nr:alpha-amylase family glycosyl hydrolase [Methylobacterium sp. WL103]
MHRLEHLHAWLDYALELGATGLALEPVFAASTHGYDTIDHFRVDPRLCEDRDFVALTQAAHTRDLRVLLDGVFNHIGRDHSAFVEVLEQGSQAPLAGWFKLSWPDGARPDPEPEDACFEGHRQLVTLNHEESAVADYIFFVMPKLIQPLLREALDYRAAERSSFVGTDSSGKPDCRF